ncbi:MAG: Jag N-terminal domain-containing protein [Chloroflexi bacterium]|nr:Jag N-terminal domain-containing protein [Chloroflexota bacterium]
MASVETTGPTVDDAIDAALEKLDLDEDQVELEILSEGADDQPARVRATPRRKIDAAFEGVLGGFWLLPALLPGVRVSP